MRMKRNWPILLIFAIFVLGAVSVFAEAEVEIQTDGANLNLRYEPSTESEVIASIPNGTIVTATRQTDDGEWMEVAYDGTVGWIDADLANVLSGELDGIVAAVETESNDKAVITNLRITSEGDSETIKVAFIRSTLGSQEEADVLALQGAQLAIEQIMADDDVLADYDIELMVYEANTTEEAAEAYEDAVDDDATIILGPNDQRQREAIFRDYAVDTPLFYVDTETSSEANVYQLGVSDDEMMLGLADYLINERYLNNIAIISIDTMRAEAGIAAFVDAAGEESISANLVHSVDTDEFLGDARDVADADAEALLLWTTDAQARLVLQALADEDWHGDVIFIGLDDDFLAATDASLSEGLLTPVIWNAVAYDVTSQQFVEDYWVRWMATPSAAAAGMYDAVQMVAQSINDGIRLSSIDYSGVLGAYSHLELGSLRLAQVVAGDLIEVAQYADGECVTCVANVLPDVRDVDAENRVTVAIGLIVPTDGSAAVYGQHAQQGAELAIREIQNNGGVYDEASDTLYTLRLQEYDMQTSADVSAAFAAATDDGVAIILGPDYNADVIPNIRLSQQAELPQFVSATGLETGGLSENDYLYQLRANDLKLASASASYLLDEREMERFATVSIHTDYAEYVKDHLRTQINASEDGVLVAEYSHDVDERDMTRIARNISQDDVEAVFVWTTPEAALNLEAALEELDWDGTLVYGYLTSENQAQFADARIEIIAPVTWSGVAGDWASQNFTQAYIERYAQAPIAQSAAYYDGVYMIAHALQTTAPDEINTWLQSGDDFRGVQGAYMTSDSTGELTQSVTLVSLDDGNLVELARYDGTTRIR